MQICIFIKISTNHHKKNMSICSSHAFCVKIENIVFLSTQVFCRSIIYTSIAFKIIYDTM